jgi:hypothetical protein
MTGIEVILRQALADFPRRDPDNRVLIRIVLRIAAEHLDAESPLLQALQLVIDGMLHHEAQKQRTPLARMEAGA